MSGHPGWCLFPIRPGRKHPPLFDNNLALASNSTAQVWAWNVQFPGCNWGLSLAKSHLIVLDVDTKEGKQGRESLDRLELEHGRLPYTRRVRTPSGGEHIYFTETNVVRHRMRLDAFGPGIDSPNYVLVPSCTLTAGGSYRLTASGPVAPAPAWFAEYLGESTVEDTDQVPAVEQDTPDIIKRAIYYLRNDAKPSIQFEHGDFALLMTAATLKDMGVSEHMAVELLAEHYNVPQIEGSGRPYCDPLWSIGEGAREDRLDVKVQNAWAYLHQTQPGADTAEADFDGEPLDDGGLDVMKRLAKEHDAARAANKPRRIRNTVLIDGVWYKRRRNGILEQVS